MDESRASDDTGRTARPLSNTGEVLGILEQCPKCLRTKWAGAKCLHGEIPPPSDDAPREPADKSKKRRKYADDEEYRAG